MLNSVLTLMSQFVMVGGGLWALWGAIVLGGGLRDQQGPQIQAGIWQLVGGGLILAAAALFKTIVIP